MLKATHSIAMPTQVVQNNAQVPARFGVVRHQLNGALNFKDRRLAPACPIVNQSKQMPRRSTAWLLVDDFAAYTLCVSQTSGLVLLKSDHQFFGSSSHF